MKYIGAFLLFLVVITSQQGRSQPPAEKDAGAADPKFVVEPDASREDLKVLHDAGLKGDGPDLLDDFRKQTHKQPDPTEIAKLIKQLGNDEFQAREKAFATLVGMGAGAMSGLKEGENDPDLEVRKRVADLRQRIESKTEAILQSAAARHLAHLKLDGTADVLLAFLPFTSDATVVDDIARTLGSVALHNGKVEPILIKSLQDPIPVKRAASGEALLRAKVKNEIPNVKKLLKDRDPQVRFRIALAMVPLADRDTLPVMVGLLGELPSDQLWPIEEALIRVAGDKAPRVSLGTDEASRKMCRDVWSKWLADNQSTIDVAKLAQEDAYLGYTMIVQQNNVIGAGRVATGEIFELDGNKNVRWKFNVDTYPVDAQMIGANRLLVAENQGLRVTERDTRGEVKWEYACGGNPFSAQRLTNGNTFIAMQGRLVEIDRNKEVVWSYQRAQNDIVRAKRLPSGEVAFITNAGVNASYTRMEPKSQKINKQFNVSQVTMQFGTLDVLPNGNVLIPHYNQNRVVEYDPNGKQVATIQQQWPNAAIRLPNGETLVSSQSTRQINVWDRNRNQVWTYTTNGTVFVARKR